MRHMHLLGLIRRTATGMPSRRKPSGIAAVPMTAGTHTVKIEFYDAGDGPATAKLAWWQCLESGASC